MVKRNPEALFTSPRSLFSFSKALSIHGSWTPVQQEEANSQFRNQQKQTGAKAHSDTQGTKAIRSTLGKWVSFVEKQHTKGHEVKTPFDTPSSALEPANTSLCVVGTLLGVSLMSGVLLSRGQEPVFVLEALVALLALQMGMFVFMLVKHLGSARNRARLAEERDSLHRRQEPVLILLLELTVRWTDKALRKLSPEHAQEAGLARSQHGVWEVCKEVFTNRLWAMGQNFAIAFNVGLLISGVWILAIRDVPFGWSTSLGLSASDIHAFARYWGVPWSFLSSTQIPLQVVEFTQWNEMTKDWVQETHRAATHAWWPFLFSSIAFYGLLPRLLFRTWLSFELRKSLKKVNKQRVEVNELLPKILNLYQDQGEQSPEGWNERIEKPFPKLSVNAPLENNPMNNSQGSAALCRYGLLVKWRDLPTDDETLSKQMGLHHKISILDFYSGGGRSADFTGEKCGRDIKENMGSSKVKPDVIVFAVESWETPSRALNRFIAGIRNSIGPDFLFYVWPVGEEVNPETWNASLLTDSNIGVLVKNNSNSQSLPVEP